MTVGSFPAATDAHIGFMMIKSLSLSKCLITKMSFKNCIVYMYILLRKKAVYITMHLLVISNAVSRILNSSSVFAFIIYPLGI